MRLAPETEAELHSNIRWIVGKRLESIEEVVLGLPTPGSDIPDKEEARQRILQAAERRDRKAEDEAFMDYTRAEVWEWWQGFSERRLLTDLYRRAAMRDAGCGDPDKQRLPTHSDGLRIAKALLMEVPGTFILDPEQEAATVSQVLAGQLLPPIGRPTRPALRDYIRRSDGWVYFEALSLIYKELKSQGKDIPRLLANWWEEVVDGRRQRPDMKAAVAAHRPTNPDRLRRDIHIQFVIELLQRLGIPPYGTHQYISGCRIVSKALIEHYDCGILPDTLALSEGTVERIWKDCTWTASFMPTMRKYSKAIAERTGLHPTEA